jgi:hypothetical protein
VAQIDKPSEKIKLKFYALQSEMPTWVHHRVRNWGKLLPDGLKKQVGSADLKMAISHSSETGVHLLLSSSLNIPGISRAFEVTSRVFPDGKVRFRASRLYSAGWGMRKPGISRPEFDAMMARLVSRLEFLPAPANHPLAAQAEQSRAEMSSLLKKAFVRNGS